MVSRTDKDLFKRHLGAINPHTFELMSEPKLGVPIFPYPVLTSATTRAMTANRLFGVPLCISRAMTLDELLIEVTGAGAGSTYARMGIYLVGPDGYPGALLIDAGTVLTDGVAVKSLAITQDLTGGLYFLAVICSGTPTIRGHKPTWTPLGGKSTSLDFIIASVYLDGANPAALPDPFGTPTDIYHEGFGQYALSSLN